jgi:bifunctional non-homologous end joining protein LigD
MSARPAKAPPTGPDWINEIKHDGFRILARRDGPKVRLISRNGHDLTCRYPLAAAAVAALPVRSVSIDGEVIGCDGKGLAVFQFIRNYRRGHIATICAFDLIEIERTMESEFVSAFLAQLGFLTWGTSHNSKVPT